jgi:hypothetical protein
MVESDSRMYLAGTERWWVTYIRCATLPLVEWDGFSFSVRSLDCAYILGVPAVGRQDEFLDV